MKKIQIIQLKMMTKMNYIIMQLRLLGLRVKPQHPFYKKLQIGYNRAARIIDLMEEEGIVSKANHVGKGMFLNNEIYKIHLIHYLSYSS